MTEEVDCSAKERVDRHQEQVPAADVVLPVRVCVMVLSLACLSSLEGVETKRIIGHSFLQNEAYESQRRQPLPTSFRRRLFGECELQNRAWQSTLIVEERFPFTAIASMTAAGRYGKPPIDTGLR